ncbi:MAG: hypothetical protein IT303_03620 [Dehalococcoidia bacterium]|nr:hypothetical protein [Dehalococcoidia bacterium]
MDRDVSYRGRWPLLAIPAGIFAFAVLILGSTVMSFDEGSITVAEDLGEQRTQLVVAQAMGFASVALLLVFSVGFYRLLQARLPQASMLSMVAGAALIASVGAGIVGYGSLASVTDTLPGDRLYFFEGDDPNEPVLEQEFPPEVKSTLYWDATNAICYSWVGVCAAAAATAVAVFKHRVLPTWTGYFSAAIGILMTLFVAVGLPFGAVFWGPLWLIVMGVALAVRMPEPAPRARMAAA